MWLSENIVFTGMFALGVALMIAILFRRSFRYQRKLRRSQSESRSQPRNFGKTPSSPVVEPLADAPPELLKWQVEMHEAAREVSGELDSKMLALQVLIRQANQQAERLEAAIKQAESRES